VEVVGGTKKGTDNLATGFLKGLLTEATRAFIEG
jgi:hypothetical protein